MGNGNSRLKTSIIWETTVDHIRPISRNIWHLKRITFREREGGLEFDSILGLDKRLDSESTISKMTQLIDSDFGCFES